MRIATLALLAAAALAAPGCISERVAIQGAVVLGPGGRAEGRVDLPAGVDSSVSFRIDGPGRADFVVRNAEGHVFQEGTLGNATVQLASEEDQTLVVVLEAYEDAGAAVIVTLQAAGRVRMGWDLSRAVPTREPAAPPP